MSQPHKITFFIFCLFAIGGMLRAISVASIMPTLNMAIWAFLEIWITWSLPLIVYGLYLIIFKKTK